MLRRFSQNLLLCLLLPSAACLSSQQEARSSTVQIKESTEEKNKAIIERFVLEFKNKVNHDIVDELFSEDFVHHLTDPRLSPGREGMKQLGKIVSGGFHDLHANIEEILVDGDFVVERGLIRAVHKGEFAGVPATGRSVTWTEIHIYKIKNGKIVEYWPQVDLMGILMQIGAIPSPS